VAPPGSPAPAPPSPAPPPPAADSTPRPGAAPRPAAPPRSARRAAPTRPERARRSRRSPRISPPARPPSPPRPLAPEAAYTAAPRRAALRSAVHRGGGFLERGGPIRHDQLRRSRRLPVPGSPRPSSGSDRWPGRCRHQTSRRRGPKAGPAPGSTGPAPAPRPRRPRPTPRPTPHPNSPTIQPVDPRHLHDTRCSSAPGTASHDAVLRHNSRLSIERAELRPYFRHNSSLIAMKPEPRPYSRRNSRLSIESREL